MVIEASNQETMNILDFLIF